LKRLALLVYFDKEPELYEWTRQEAFNKKTDMTEIIRDLIRKAQK
jgi:hypothetical protein